jgi:hypothetical protein
MMARANLGKTPDERGLEEYPADWQEDFQRLSGLVLELAARHGENILIRFWDPRSLQGMFKSIRYGVRRYPTFVINRHEKVTGLDAALLEQVLRSQGL